MNEGNTLLSDDEVTMAVILRINREWMEYMRKAHAAEARQAYNMTLIDLEMAKQLEDEEEE